MKVLTATIALTLAAFSVSAGAEDASAYTSWGACISDWVNLSMSNQKGKGSSITKSAPQYQCVQIGDYWYLVPVVR
jgi:hypothetical protein